MKAIEIARRVIQKTLAAFKSGAIHTCSYCYRDEWDDELADLKHICEDANDLLKKHYVFEKFETADQAIAAWKKMPDDVPGVGQDLYQCNIVKWLYSEMQNGVVADEQE